MHLTSGRLNTLIDGQFGSTGKGLLACYIALYNHIDIAVSNASVNAGHTFHFAGKKIILKQLPVTGVVQDRCQIFLSSGSIIHPETLLREMEEHNISGDRVIIHPRAAVIEEEDIQWERNPESSVTKIASTQSGVGRALSRKIERSALLAQGCDELRSLVKDFSLHPWLQAGYTALMEVPQGLDLSLCSGLSYPHCTSREITVSGALSDAQVHPRFLGKTAVCLRTYPIRVGNILHEGQEIGNSGPFYPDSTETSWEALGVPAERTTVTNRIRRVATFSHLQYQRMLDILQPNYILLNFANYMDKNQLDSLLSQTPEVTHLGFGPTTDDIVDARLHN